MHFIFPQTPRLLDINSLSLHMHVKLSDTYLMEPPAMHSRGYLSSKAPKKVPASRDLPSAGHRAEDMRSMHSVGAVMEAGL